MDSGNSGSASLQSSSGGDDEDYDSHHQSFIPSAAGFSYDFTAISTLSSSPLLGHHLSTPALFDPASTYLQPLTSHSQQPNSLLSIDLLRSSRLLAGNRSAANCTELGSFTQQQQSMTFGHHHSVSNPSLAQSRSVFPDNGAAQLGKLPTSPSSGGLSNHTTLGVRNSKKRTRASRRAPTTVLTTDTHNFRAMVQEFTGIPAPPFSTSPYSRRLDLFGSSALRSVHLDPLGPSLYPLRPSAHKIQPAANPFISSSPSLLNNSAAGNFSSSGPDSNFLNIQNPIVSLQSLLQQPQQQKMLSSLEDQIQLGTAQTHHQPSAGWRSGSIAGSSQHQPRASDGAVNEAGYNNSSSALEHHNVGKFNYSEHVSARGDGTVDSWICPSD